jgi:hypothetical protein
MGAEMKLLGVSLTVPEILGIVVPGAIGTYLLGLLICGFQITSECLLIPKEALWPAAVLIAFTLGMLAQPLSNILDELYDRTYRRWKRRHGDLLYEFAREEAKKQVPDIEKIGSVYEWAKSEVKNAQRKKANRRPNKSQTLVQLLSRIYTDYKMRDEDIDHKVGKMQGYSKMYRGLSLYFLLGAVLFGILGPNWAISIACLVALILSLLVFFEERFKATHCVYQAFYDLKHRRT